VCFIDTSNLFAGNYINRNKQGLSTPKDNIIKAPETDLKRCGVNLLYGKSSSPPLFSG
jgi:hypothetical protein